MGYSNRMAKKCGDTEDEPMDWRGHDSSDNNHGDIGMI